MQIPTKKLQSGFEMPVFGLGTWQMGGRTERDLQNDDSADIVAIQNALDAGVTHIDTAERYANGHAEELVGVAMKGYDRSKLFIASKVGPNHFHYEDLLRAAKHTVNRLQTDYLDLYYLHEPNIEVSIAETMKAMTKLKNEGIIKNIAVSNFTIARFQEAQSHTPHKIVANQLHLNLIYRETQRKGLVRYCEENDIMLVAWRPVQKGILSTDHNQIMDIMCKKYGKTPSQIAINWLISQKNIVTLSKTRSKEHLVENLGALDFSMTDEDIEKLDKDFPGQQDVSDAMPLI